MPRENPVARATPLNQHSIHLECLAQTSNAPPDLRLQTEAVRLKRSEDDRSDRL